MEKVWEPPFSSIKCAVEELAANSYTNEERDRNMRDTSFPSLLSFLPEKTAQRPDPVKPGARGRPGPRLKASALLLLLLSFVDFTR